jgi:hypothetical protein
MMSSVGLQKNVCQLQRMVRSLNVIFPVAVEDQGVFENNGLVLEANAVVV